MYVNFLERKPHLTLFPKDDNGREINIFLFEDCKLEGDLIYPYTCVQDRDITINPYKEKTMSTNEELNYIPLSTSNTIDKIVEDPMFFFIYNKSNYYHFLYDTLPYLISYFHLRSIYPDLKICMEDTTNYRFVNEFLDLLQITEIVKAKPNTLYRRLFISSSYTHDGLSNCPPRMEIYSLYKSMIPNVITPQYPKKIYISRRTWISKDKSNIGTDYTTRRRMVNEDELVERLCRENFIEVFAEKLTTKEKIELFSQAEVVVGSIGGGIANVLFSNEKCLLICIVSPDFLEINRRFKFSLDRCNVKYFQDTKLKYLINGLSPYMRVKIRDSEHPCCGRIGEISSLSEEDITIQLSRPGAVSWSENENFDNVKLRHDQIIKLDEGLNSPFEVDIQKFMEFLNTSSHDLRVLSR